MKKSKIFQMKVDPVFREELRKYSDMLGISTSAFVRMAVIEKMNKIQGK